MIPAGAVTWQSLPVAIWREYEGAAVAPSDHPTLVSIGNFDGVHRGHQAVLAQCRTHHAELPIAAVTFDPHPLAVVAPERAPRRLTTFERRVELLRAHGADEVRVLAFDSEMASWSPDDFVRRVIVEQLHAELVVVGENFRFGHKAAGDLAFLREAGARHGFDVEGLAIVSDGGALSSTRVRELVAAGDLPGAALVLGRPHEVSGVVRRGDQRGRELGFPTANVPVDESYAVPPDGVYAGWLVRGDGERLPAAISVGTNPTFDGVERRVESYVLDRTDLDLYGEAIRVEFVERLRGMVAYEGVEPLIAQMHDDVAQTRRLLGL
ncbi:MAG: riboflavin kinase / adenylyltransferase [Nocardioidaceae bacterium]|nr:riboflavin kinase / adenylyltransferase [Nocardioidaceae bacterium]